MITFVKVFPLLLTFLCGVLLIAKWRKERVFGNMLGRKIFIVKIVGQNFLALEFLTIPTNFGTVAGPVEIVGRN